MGCRVSYWGIKSTNEFFSTIKKYSDNLHKVVLDPYGGSGALIEMILKLGKRGIYNDVNPIAYLVAKYNITINDDHIEQLEKCVEKIKNELSDLNNLFREYCQTCGNIRNVKFRIYENNVAIAHLECGHTAETGDVDYSPPQWALAPLSYGTRPFIKAKRNLKIADLFTRRNLTILDKLSEIISKCPEVMKYIMIPVIYLASKMAFIPKSKEARLLSGERWSPSWALPAYWLPNRYIEFNPLEIIETRVKLLKSCKKRKYIIGSVNDVLSKRAHVAFLNGDTSSLPLPDNSVDILTDPPYPTDIQYGELYYLHALILRMHYDVFNKELIVNKNRGLTISEYMRIFDKHLTEFQRVLKRNAIFIIKDDKYTDKLIDIIGNHFNIIEIDNIVINKRRSRIGDFKDEYHYRIVITNNKR